MFQRTTVALTLVVFFVYGCGKPADEPPSPAETEAREAFAKLQDTIKSKDDAKLWQLLDAKAQSDADDAAIIVLAKLAKADADGKTKLEDEYGLPRADLAVMTGPGFLKTKPFHKKYDELPESKTEKVTVLGKQATVTYTEPDGDHKKLILMLRDGQWKAVLAMPSDKK